MLKRLHSVGLQCWLVLSTLLWIAPLACAADDARVVLVLSEGNALYQNFATTFKQNLPVNIQLEILPRAENFTEANTNDLIVSVGVKAADWVAVKTSKPLLAAMIPSNKYAELLKNPSRTKNISAIYLDQPLLRQANFLRVALPARSKIGLLYSPQTPLNIDEFRQLLAKRNASLIAQSSVFPKPLFEDLDAVLSRSEVLLAVPDNSIYNSNTIRNILLSSYRRSVPLVGFSQAYVNAGALCAIFSTPEQLAIQTRAAVVSFLQTRKLNEAAFPTYYSIAVNQEVARTLGISIESPEVLRTQLDKAQ